MKIFLYIACVTIVSSGHLMARPVSYPTGTTFMQMNDTNLHSIHIHYSPTIHYSLGYKGEYWRDEKWQFHGLQLNNLVKRWNKPASQANFYLKSGAGIVQDSDSNNDLAAFTGISLDWENRRFFTFYENRLYKAGDVNRFFTQKVRAGIAPYLGDYGDWHTWLMLQVDHNPEKIDPITITPLIRIFKSEYLTEIGINEDGDALVNFVIRF